MNPDLVLRTGRMFEGLRGLKYLILSSSREVDGVLSGGPFGWSKGREAVTGTLADLWAAGVGGAGQLFSHMTYPSKGGDLISTSGIDTSTRPYPIWSTHLI